MSYFLLQDEQVNSTMLHLTPTKHIMAVCGYFYSWFSERWVFTWGKRWATKRAQQPHNGLCKFTLKYGTTVIKYIAVWIQYHTSLYNKFNTVHFFIEIMEHLCQKHYILKIINILGHRIVEKSGNTL